MINIGIGIGWAKAIYSVANNVIANFKARVLSYPTSIFEAGPCLDATLEELNAIGLLNNASLVITPNAYNEGILYDVVPNTTLGDMGVVRATTATRVNEQGLVEVVPYNLVTYSNTFTSWESMGSVTITANATTSPSGKTDAYLLKSNTNQSDRIQKSLSLTGKLTQSAYIKYAGYNVTVRLTNNLANSDLYVNVTSTSVTLNSVGSAVSNYSITPVGDGWYQITRTSEGFNYFQFWIDFSSNKGGVYAYGFQVNEGNIKDYLPTTTRLNIPRIDYTNGGCPSVLVEPQRTNLVEASQTFSNWTKQTTVDLNSTISPDGTLNAALIGDSRILRTFTTVVGSYVFSVFVKQNTSQYVGLDFIGGASGSVYYDFINQTLNGSFSSNSEIISYTNGWFRLIIKLNVTSTSLTPFIYGDGYFTAPGGSSYVWGAQLEAGSNATSYIPTVASAVTRNADVISKTGISDLIGQTEGTLFAEFNNTKTDSVSRYIYAISNGNLTTFNFEAIITNSNELLISSRNNGDTQVSYNYGVVSLQKYKIAYSYSENNTRIFINGLLVFIDTLCTIPTADSVKLGMRSNNATPLNDSINQLLLFKTQLNDAECIALTTL